ncbi:MULTISPECIES: translation elongation factor Ts [Cyanophyceae]|uniref:Elongation factor Ts n=1 Tax=Nodularia spumigena CENA596 TaxID=1819295 RepID=A0A166JUJ4_NODSP|nr:MULTISPECIES: translation elongation factor Ts [Cyanophyceae]MDB9357459.1 translation elongation factor Ts [Nodularia spumigena CS-587/03]KZL50148.1 elongation factor Ts [Nodularia spumigena CENA596]MDB9306364.1 translation elongation factor Ts [Nodularia spumigena CS-591/12]MDB9340664.1 translation elongation factor Ts [Nodularia spumigena CS-589/07]MDB9344300.1 translation elongation factor Ts [Nodularia spumigena CS-588/06]
MAEISAKLVQELRQKTGAGMMDCKKALKENDGDIEKAIEWLRQKGIASAGKKSDRIAAEGLIDTYIQPGGRVGVLIEVNCQTDFVARNEAFKALVKNLAQQATTADSVESLLAQPYIEETSVTVDQFIKQTIAQLGENIQVRRFINFALPEGQQGVVDSYIHTGGRVGVLVELNAQTETAAQNEEFQTLAKNAAMQVAACPNVEYVSVDQIPAEFAQKETEIEMGRDDLGNKPQNIKEKIVQGRIEKRLKELTLLDQPFIRDQSISVEDLVKQVKNKVGEEIKVNRFVRYILGEGIEKQEISFAEEVAAQMGSK